ncbi:MAG: hypothetical protein ACFFA5_05390 [Promethearchaeota archaeon]
MKLMVPIAECPVDRPSSYKDELRYTVEGKTRVTSPLFGYDSENSQKANEFICG